LDGSGGAYILLGNLLETAGFKEILFSERRCGRIQEDGDPSFRDRSDVMKSFCILGALFLSGCVASPFAKVDYRAEYDTYRAAVQNGTCHVHGGAMTKKVVPIQYGLPGGVEMEPPQEVRLKQFPFTGRSPEGGCAIEPGAPRTTVVSVCPECIAAEKRWLKRG
jgi:hypothetical protein